jgi:hypothetical protein
MTMARPSYAVSAKDPGSDAAGEAAAALASAALLFKGHGGESRVKGKGRRT